MERVNRRRFLKGAGATGAAAFVGVPGISKTLTDEPATVVEKPGPVTNEPVLVYVRDAARGEVTVMHGTRATTYRDRALVRRLLEAARATAESTPWEVR
jgi:TAT (twin-arginine translocation) pathway signal sequence